jgi:nitrite reductase (NADH) large subunit
VKQREPEMSEPLVVIGNGMAAARFVEELAACALGRYAVAVVGEEPQLAYNRVLLSSVLARDATLSDIELKPAAWWRERGVTLIYGCAAKTIETKQRRVHLADGTTLAYSRLVLATGSHPIRLPIPGMDLPGVLTFRGIGDVAAIGAASRKGTRAVVIGGGLLGLEAAHGLARAGADVTLVHLMDRLMERQLDARAASMLRRELESRGITIMLQAETAAIEGSGRVEAVTLKDGRSLPADLVVVAVGIKPNVGLARAAGVEVDRGVLIDDYLETSTPRIHAIGECAEYRGNCYGLVEPAYEQASALAGHLAGRASRYAGSVLATNLKVSGVNVFSAGDFLGAPGTEQIVFSDPGIGTYKKLVIADGRLAGAVLFGDTADGLWYFELIRSGLSIEPLRDDLMFGRAMAERLAA